MTALPPSLIKATNGDYQLSFRAIFLETWQRIRGRGKNFWWKFFLFFLITLTIEFLLSSGLFSITSFYLKKSILRKGLYLLSDMIWKVLMWLLSISLVFLALKYIQNVKIHASMVIAAVKDWKVLSSVAIYYVIMSMVMARLLVLDKRISFTLSLSLAFKAINRRFIKNFSLVLLEWLIFLVCNTLVSILIVHGMKFIGPGKWIFILSLGGELIWFPVFALIAAIQYRQIFCEGEPVFKMCRPEKGISTRSQVTKLDFMR